MKMSKEFKEKIQYAFSADVVEEAIYPNNIHNLIKAIILLKDEEWKEKIQKVIQKISGSHYEEKEIWRTFTKLLNNNTEK